MVDTSDKIAQIKRLIDNESYFTINRARQYGKTTTLYEIRRRLSNEYLVVKISFEGLGEESFASSEHFCSAFLEQIADGLQSSSVDADQEYIEQWENCNIKDFKSLSRHITKMCKDRKIVLLIDEVDKTSNNRVFLQFLSTLRTKFLARQGGDDYTFHSVILAGVYDIKNIKLNMINEGLYTPASTEAKIYNSPWNIAVNFNVDMSFSSTEIKTMLSDYESEHDTGMNIAEIADEIYRYTNGYPFLVSRICQCIDEELARNWAIEGTWESVKTLIIKKNTLFDDLFKNLENNEELYTLIYDMLIVGKSFSFSIHNPTISLGAMYGIIKKDGLNVSVSNKIFETLIVEYLISKDETSASGKKIRICESDVADGNKFDMELCLRKFADHYAEIFTTDDIEFLERHGRLLFLSYLRPLINGNGFYHIESQFTDLRRMDIVVDYGSDQFIIELKLWRGEKAERKAYDQLLGYMDSKKADTGYLLVFNFNKEKNKERKAEWVKFDGKRIFEVMI
jgi:hypothetical protein